MQKITSQKQAFLCQQIDKAPNAFRAHRNAAGWRFTGSCLKTNQQNKPNYLVCGLKGSCIYRYTIKDWAILSQAVGEKRKAIFMLASLRQKSEPQIPTRPQLQEVYIPCKESTVTCASPHSVPWGIAHCWQCHAPGQEGQVRVGKAKFDGNIQHLCKLMSST